MEYIRWNEFDVSPNLTLNTEFTVSSINGNWGLVRTVSGKSSGKWYWEYKVNFVSGSSQQMMLGAVDVSHTLNSYIGAGIGAAYYSTNGNAYQSNVNKSYGQTYFTNDIIGVALDLDYGTIEFFRNGMSQGIAYSNLSGIYYPAYSSAVASASATVNFGLEIFDIVKTNSQNWNRLKSQGYLPYDYVNAEWFNLDKGMINVLDEAWFVKDSTFGKLKVDSLNSLDFKKLGVANLQDFSTEISRKQEVVNRNKLIDNIQVNLEQHLDFKLYDNRKSYQNLIDSFEHVVYVDSTNGDDDNIGSEKLPKKTLLNAITTSEVNGCIVLKQGEFGVPEFATMLTDKKLTFVGKPGESIINILHAPVNGSLVANNQANFHGLIFQADINITGDTRFIYYSSSLTKMRFYNCLFRKQNNRPSVCYFAWDNAWASNKDVIFENCLFDGQTSAQEATQQIYLNCGFTMTHSTGTRRSCLNLVSFNQDFDIVTPNPLARGEGCNPDGRLATIGLFGGKFAWGEWSDSKFVFKLNNKYFTFDEEFIELEIEQLNKQIFQDFGLDTLASIPNGALSDFASEFEIYTYSSHWLDYFYKINEFKPIDLLNQLDEYTVLYHNGLSFDKSESQNAELIQTIPDKVFQINVSELSRIKNINIL